jgi:indole-3-glycerol phosphate synthase
MPTTLDEILAATRARVAAAKRPADLRALERQAAEHTPRGFRAALARAASAGPAIIAELKQASPSQGMLRGTLHVGALVPELAAAGAAALSVVTEEQFFRGSLANLGEASAASALPCLRKDFILDEFQVIESRAHCADALLLIVAALADAELASLGRRSRELELDVLCEVHDKAELQRALDAGFDLIGVNSRDLRTFQVDLGTALRLAPRIPAGVMRVAESGISSGDDLAVLRKAGYQAFLIGESLMRAEEPGKALKALVSGF